MRISYSIKSKMSIYRLTLIVMTSLYWSLAQSDDTFFSFGGGCGGNKVLNSFASPFESKARSKGYEVVRSFHDSDTPSVGHDGPGTEIDLLARLDQVIKKYESPAGSCKTKNCQFILNISSHGFPGDVVSDKVKHSVCGADGAKVDLSKVRKKLLVLNKMGINIGIIDESCFSGGSLDLFSDFSCVLTSASKVLPHNSPSQSASYGRSLSKFSTAPVSFLDLAVTQLLHVSNVNLMQNTPLVGSPDSDPILDRLNKISNSIGQSMKTSLYKDFMQEFKFKTPTELKAFLSSCSTLFNKFSGLPMEVVTKDPRFIELKLDPKMITYCSKVTYVRNHASLISESQKWDQQDYDSFLGELSCEMIPETGVEALAKEAISIGTSVGPSSSLNKSLNEIAGRKDVKTAADAAGFSCSTHLEKSSLAVVAKEVTSLSGCVNLCTSQIESLSRLKNADKYYVASVCVNKLKALKLIASNLDQSNLCQRIKI